MEDAAYQVKGTSLRIERQGRTAYCFQYALLLQRRQIFHIVMSYEEETDHLGIALRK